MEIETKQNQIILKKVYNSITLETDKGKQLHICMRDSGYEIKLDNGDWHMIESESDLKSEKIENLDLDKATQVLQSLKPTEKNYKSKVKLLSKIINNKDAGHICPDKLVKWCTKVGLKTKLHCEDRISWWTVSGQN